VGADDKEKNYDTETSVRVHAGLNKLEQGTWNSYIINRVDCPWLDNKVYTLPEQVYVWIKLHRRFTLDCPADYKTERESHPSDVTTLPYDRTIQLVARQGKKRIWLEAKKEKQATCLTPIKAKGAAGRAKHTVDAGNPIATNITRKLLFTPANRRKQVRIDHPTDSANQKKQKRVSFDLTTEVPSASTLPDAIRIGTQKTAVNSTKTTIPRTISCKVPNSFSTGLKQALSIPVLEKPGNIAIDQTLADSFFRTPASPSKFSKSDFVIDSRQPLAGLDLLDYSSENSEAFSSPVGGVFDYSEGLPSYSECPSPISEDKWIYVSTDSDIEPEKA